MRMSTWVMLIGGVVALVDSMPTILPASIAGSYDASTGVGTGLLGLIDPIDNKLPIVQNVGIWIVGVGAVMRFGFGK